jgi:hypothetical protein
MNPSEEWLEKYGRFWPNVTGEPKKWYQMTTREMYDLHMDTYTQDTAVLSFTKTDHPSYQFIKNQLGMRAVPYLLEDIQAQHPDGSFDHNSYHSFWGACSLFRTILYENEVPGPEIPEPFRGRLKYIREIYVDWGVKEEFLKDNHVPSIPLRWDQVHRLVPNRFFGLRNYVWRLTTLPNRHRMKHKWDLWRAI